MRDRIRSKKKERFCLKITTAQIGLTTQERQNQVKKKKGKVLPADNKSPNRLATALIRMTGKKSKNEGSSLTEISQVI